MNIFEQLDNLIRIAGGVKSINESKIDITDIPIDPNCETAEQARDYVRDYFKNMIDNDGGGGGGTPPPEPPKKISGPKPPPPPFKKKMDDGGGEKSKDFEEDELLWDDDEILKELKMDDDALDKELEEEDDDYDDFLDESGKGSGGDGESGDGDGDDDEDFDDDEEDEDGPGGDTGEGREEGEEGESGEGKSGKSSKGESGDDEGGESGESGESKSDGSERKREKGKESGSKPGTSPSGSGSDSLKSSIDDAIERLKERNDADKEKLKKLSDMAKDDSTTKEDIEHEENAINAEKDGKSMDKVKDLIGKAEHKLSDDKLRKEIEDSKISDEDKKALSDSMSKATAPPAITDDELEELKKEAVEELDKKCKGYSSLSTEILYHALKDAKIESDDWKKIIEQILKDKSVHHGKEDSKIKKYTWGNHNQLWRGAILPTKTVRRGGSDTQSIYCFVDYSGSVRSRSNLIISFLGKVMELCTNLQYTDMVVYTFADTLSLPKRLTKEMVDKDGYEKVLAQTIAFFDDPSNDVGGKIEDFSLVANQFNKIKSKDKDAVAFIFGDGVWTFYGNTQPPVRLKEMCPKYLKDICAFVFYEPGFLDNLKKEISYLRNVAGIENVITTKISDIKPDSKY